MHLTVDYFVEISNLITGSNNITLIRFSVNRYGFDKMYIDKELIEDKLCQIIDQFNERANFYSLLLSKIMVMV